MASELVRRLTWSAPKRALNRLQNSAAAASQRLQRSSSAAAAQTSSGQDVPVRCPFHRASTSTTTSVSGGPARVRDDAGVRPYEAIPTPKGLPIIGTTWDLVKCGAMANLHQYCTRRHAELGPIYRERLGVTEGVFIADSRLIQKVYLNDGKYPKHLVPEPWIIYNEMTGNQRGLFFMDGEQWGSTRKSLNRVFLQSSNTESQNETFNDIITDVLRRWGSICQNGELPNLEKELYKWTIESLGTMIFGRRLGCLEDNGPKIIETFVQCVQEIFVESATMNVIPPKLAHAWNLPVWKRFVKAATTSLDASRNFVEETISDSLRKAENGKKLDGILHQLLVNDNIQQEEFVRIVNDLIVASAHTTSPSAQWALYLLAKNGDWQDELLAEIRKAVPSGEMVRPHHLDSLPLVKAVVKESLRMYPVAPFLTRILTDDLVLDNYHIPAGKLVLMSMFTTSRDPKYFPEPDRFNPARWLRKENSREVISTHACLPFGLGARSCVGRRVAEVQMHLLLARVVQKFQLELANTSNIEIKLRMITTPSEEIRLKLTERAG